jgi:hypothetical protein
VRAFLSDGSRFSVRLDFREVVQNNMISVFRHALHKVEHCNKPDFHDILAADRQCPANARVVASLLSRSVRLRRLFVLQNGPDYVPPEANERDRAICDLLDRLYNSGYRFPAPLLHPAPAQPTSHAQAAAQAVSGRPSLPVPPATQSTGILRIPRDSGELDILLMAR